MSLISCDSCDRDVPREETALVGPAGGEMRACAECRQATFVFKDCRLCGGLTDHARVQSTDAPGYRWACSSELDGSHPRPAVVLFSCHFCRAQYPREDMSRCGGVLECVECRERADADAAAAERRKRAGETLTDHRYPWMWGG